MASDWIESREHNFWRIEKITGGAIAYSGFSTATPGMTLWVMKHCSLPEVRMDETFIEEAACSKYCNRIGQPLENYILMDSELSQGVQRREGHALVVRRNDSIARTYECDVVQSTADLVSRSMNLLVSTPSTNYARKYCRPPTSNWV